MKICFECKEEKSDDSFHKKGSRLSPRCKPCTKEYRARLYSEWTPEQHLALRSRVKERNIEFQNKVSEIKESSPCTDCGNYYPSVVMDFDHIEDNKIANVSKLIKYGSWTKIQEEISKCELVCSNCHRIRTRDRNVKVLCPSG